MSWNPRPLHAYFQKVELIQSGILRPLNTCSGILRPLNTYNGILHPLHTFTKYGLMESPDPYLLVGNTVGSL